MLVQTYSTDMVSRTVLFSDDAYSIHTANANIFSSCSPYR